MYLTEGAGLAHAGRLNIILPQLSEHIGHHHIYDIIVQNVLKLLNMSKGIQRRTSDLPNPFGDRGRTSQKSARSARRKSDK
jgi:hypothetical protein